MGETKVYTGLTARARRMMELTGLAAGHGLDHLLVMLGFVTPKRGGKQHAITTPERLRDFFAAAGATFVKLGQKLSTRTDLLNPDYAAALAELQENVPPPPLDTMRAVLLDELGRPLSEVFSEFDETPVASASIGVVFKATLARDGRQVAVKVRRPGIRQQVAVDLQILEDVAHRIEQFAPKMRRHHPVAVVREFAESLKEELDFRLESERTERLRKVIADHPDVEALSIVSDLTTERLLVTEWIDGIDPADHRQLDQCGANRSRLAQNIAMSILRQAIDHGVFHGDPHPGNVRITRAGKAEFLDFGNVVFIGQHSRHMLSRLLNALFLERAEQVVTVLVNAGIVGPNVKIHLLQHDIDHHIAKHLSGTHNPNFQKLIVNFLSTIRVHQLGLMPPEWIALLLAVGMAENLCRTLDPNFNLADVGRELTRMQHRERAIHDPVRFLRESWLQAQSMADLLRSFPNRFERIMTRVEGGGLKLRFEHDNSKETFRPFRPMVNRLATGIVLSGMLVTSGLLLISPLSAAQTAGYIFLTLSSVGLAMFVWSILRSGGT